MACGRMVLTDRLPPHTEIDRLFTENEDIVYYDNAEDAVRKVDYYIEHPSERKAIAASGALKVHANHTVKNRADQFEALIERIQHDLKQPTS
jgi:spore maturation protein CgeB